MKNFTVQPQSDERINNAIILIKITFIIVGKRKILKTGQTFELQ